MYDFNTLISDVQNLRTNNIADYKLFPGYVCCGWMDFHDDYYSGAEENPEFEIEIFWINPFDDITFVHTSDNLSWIFEKFEVGKRYKFNARNNHALVPSLFVDRTKLSNPQDIRTHLVSANLDGLAEILTSPKVIFKFL